MMKKVFYPFMGIILFLTACSVFKPEQSLENVDNPSNKVLIAYFSRVGNTVWDENVDAVTSASINVVDGEFVGNTQVLAEMIQQVTDGDLFFIKTVSTYPSDYKETTNQATVEQGKNSRPALSSHVENMEQYDTVVLVYPIWWGTVPHAVMTFLEEYDFTDKTILPLCSHEGSGIEDSIEDIKKCCPNSVISDGLWIKGSDIWSAQSEVENWLKSIS